MKASQIRWLSIATLVFVVAWAYFFSGKIPVTYGVSSEWVNGRYHFSAGSSPWALILSATIILEYFFLMCAAPSDLGKPLTGLVRRYFGFWMDFILVMLAIGPMLGILPIVVEWKRTGIFQWSIERDTPAAGDLLLATVSILPAFVGLLFYYAWPLTRSRPSPGTSILNYQVIHENGEALPIRLALLRSLLGFVAIASFPLAFFISRDSKNGQFWVDKIFGTKALLSR